MGFVSELVRSYVYTVCNSISSWILHHGYYIMDLYYKMAHVPFFPGPGNQPRTLGGLTKEAERVSTVTFSETDKCATHTMSTSCCTFFQNKY